MRKNELFKCHSDDGSYNWNEILFYRKNINEELTYLLKKTNREILVSVKDILTSFLDKKTKK